MGGAATCRAIADLRSDKLDPLRSPHLGKNVASLELGWQGRGGGGVGACGHCEDHGGGVNPGKSGRRACVNPFCQVSLKSHGWTGSGQFPDASFRARSIDLTCSCANAYA